MHLTSELVSPLARMVRHPQHSNRSMRASLFGLMFVLFGSHFAHAQEAGEKLLYNRDIRPILADYCFACHGPDSAARKAELRLDRSADATAKREMGFAIVPGMPDESEILVRMISEDPNEVMPPPATKKKVKPEEIAKIKQWIAQGAEYQLHWSFLPIVRHAPPTVKNEAWVRNPIDRFILARLESVGLTPAPEADRRTLARRLALDLTGLPPAPEIVEAFVKDTSPDAYEKLVDHFLDSTRWGEHRAKYWLDAARYADTHGLHFDNFREMWTYRDWVIKAFNKNMPFDQFTIEQLAGDLLLNPTLDQKIASGFNRCLMTTNEGGTIPEENLVGYTRDRTETTAQVWLGLTAGCSVCHDHKFDPLPQREFYQMAAFFNNTTQGAMDGNIKETPPIIPVAMPEDQVRLAALDQEIPQARKQVEDRKGAARPEFDTWLASAKIEALLQSIPQDKLALHAPLNEGQGITTNVVLNGQKQETKLAPTAQWQPGASGAKALQVQGAALEIADFGKFDKDQAFTCSAWVKLPANDGSGAICARMNKDEEYRGWDFWVQQRRVGTHIINTWPGNALKVVGQAQVPANEWTHVTVSYDGSGKASGVKVFYNGQPQATNVEADKLSATTVTEVPFKVGQRHNTEPLSAAGIEDLRIYQRALTPAEVEALAKTTRFASILAKAPEQRTDAEKNELFTWWLGTYDEPYKTGTQTVQKLEQEQAAIKARGTVAYVMQEKSEEALAFILFRGEYDKRRDQVKPQTPALLPPMTDAMPRNRLGFAQWLLEPQHPLTARVTVNRFWQEVFGTGIVRSSGDFGVAGELPTHPELLDWLAVEFRESGWDIKKFFKLLVTSATYRQAAVTTKEKMGKDPANQLLSRGPRFRMESEMVRDYALAASGLLSSKIGGPSVRPYQPDGVWEAVAMIGSNTRDYRRDTGDNLYRRSMYTFWKRAAPPASMEIFNAPSRETCTVRRERSNTPLQALVTLNDIQFVEAARFLAQRAIKEAGATPEEKINFLTARLISRPLQPQEMTIVRGSFHDLEAYYKAHVEDAQKLIAVGDSKADPQIDPATLAAWTMLTNELFNLDEVLNK